MIDINNIKGLQELFKEKLFEVASTDRIIEDIYPIVRLANHDIEYDNVIWDICADIAIAVNDFQLYKFYADEFHYDIKYDFEDDTLYAQNGISSAYFTNFTGIKELQGTVKGCSIIETKKSFHILNPEEGEIIPLQVETEYTGSDDAVWQCPYVDLMLYNNGSEVDFTVEVDMMGTENQSVKKNIHLKKCDFKNDYCKVRVSPKVNNGQGFKVSIYSKSKVSIMSIAPKIERISDAGLAGVLV